MGRLEKKTTRERERNRKERTAGETSVANLLLLGFLLTEKNLTLSSSSSQGSIVIGLGSTRLDTARLLLGTWFKPATASPPVLQLDCPPSVSSLATTDSHPPPPLPPPLGTSCSSLSCFPHPDKSPPGTSVDTQPVNSHVLL